MITTHVLDLAAGKPGRGIAIELERTEHGVWKLIGGGITDDDGRLRTLTPTGPVAEGTYRIRFQTGPYFAAISRIFEASPMSTMSRSVGRGKASAVTAVVSARSTRASAGP